MEQKRLKYETEIAQNRAAMRMSTAALNNALHKFQEVMAEEWFYIDDDGDITFEMIEAVPFGQHYELPTVKGGAIFGKKTIYGDKSLQILENDWTKGSILPNHYHSNAGKLLTVHTGLALVVLEIEPGIFEKKYVAAGESIYIEAGVKHLVTAIEAMRITIEFYYIDE